jgi:GNAT superfamily N-acetyltransferase
MWGSAFRRKVFHAGGAKFGGEGAAAMVSFSCRQFGGGEARMVTVRRAVPEDARDITTINVYTWKTAYAELVPEELIGRRIAELEERTARTRDTIAREDCFFVAVDDGAVIGFCMYGPCRDGACAGTGEIYAMYVPTDRQGRGAGRALFEAAARALKARGFAGMIVNCLDGNPALGFYERMGGKRIARWSDDGSGYRLEGETLRFPL